MKLKDRVALITGGGRGLGREMALALAEEGAHLVLAARTESEIEDVAREIRSLGRKVMAVQADVSVEEQVSLMVQKALDEFSTIDILVNNAGGPLDSYKVLLRDLSLAQWRQVLDVNLTGAFLCSRAVSRHMMERQKGVIINISSGMGRRGRAGMVAYSAAKFGVEGLTQAMALELAPFNIRVNSLAPGGPTATRGTLRHGDIPVEALLKPEVIRGVAVFLASDDSIGVTGQALTATLWNADRKDTRLMLDR